MLKKKKDEMSWGIIWLLMKEYDTKTVNLIDKISNIFSNSSEIIDAVSTKCNKTV